MSSVSSLLLYKSPNRVGFRVRGGPCSAYKSGQVTMIS
ncbi:hypothetical protein OROMI_033277 [Orobanche minor]